MKKIQDFLTVDEVSKYLRIPKGTIYKLSMTKKIPCFKVGKRLRFRKQSIDEWIEQQEQKVYKKHKNRRRKQWPLKQNKALRT